MNKLEFLQSYLTEERKDRIEQVLNNRTQNITVVLEDIYHAPNASAVVRTCDCFGIQDLYVIENEKRNRVNKCVTQGCGKWVTINKFNKAENNTKECFEYLSEKGYKTVATTLSSDKTISIHDLPIESEKLAICFGSEENGLTKEAHDLADYHITLPMYGFTQSFNISVTAALCLQILVEKLRNSDIDHSLPKELYKELLFKWVEGSVKHSKKLLEYYDEKYL